MNKRQKALIKGCLQVIAIQDTKMGLSDAHVPKDTIGYVLGVQHDPTRYLIYWPTIQPGYKGDWCTASHDPKHVIPTGRRG